MFSWTIILICFGGIVFCCYMLRRNNLVYAERMRLLDLISARAGAMIAAGDYSWMRLYNRLDSISYEFMLNRFWRPVSSFYDVKSLLE